MRSLGGFILLAGIGVALFVYLPAPVDSGASLDRLQRVAASRSAQLPPAKFTPVSRLGSFSPPSPCRCLPGAGRDPADGSSRTGAAARTSAHRQRRADGLADDGRLRRNACAN